MACSVSREAQEVASPRRGTTKEPHLFVEQPSAKRLSSKYLLPDEERELEALQNSLGVAKDWLERSVTTKTQ